MERKSQHTGRAAPRATVLVPVLNNEPYIGACIHSLLTQWRSDLELLVLDDGSTDRSFEIAREALVAYPQAHATLLRNDTPQGMAALPNLLRRAAGEIIIHADSDDLALPGRLDAILSCFDADPSCRLVTSNAVLLSSDGIPIKLYNTFLPDEIISDPLIPAAHVGGAQWLGATLAYHRSVLEDFPPIDAELFPYGLDLLLPFRVTLIGSHHYLAEPKVGWRQHSRNTHRLAGAFSTDDQAFERHAAFELMALAQKIRDANFVRARSPDSNRLEEAAAQCQKLFLEHFTRWSRVRNRLRRFSPAEAAQEAAASAIAIPPITTLRRGERRFFGQTESLGDLAHSWSGIHDPEEHWNWTSRVALIGFRLTGDGGDRIELGLAGAGHLGLQHVRVSVNFGPTRSFEVGPEEAAVVLPIDKGSIPDLLALVFHVPDAAKPADTTDSADQRLLGLRLISIQVL